MAGFVYLLVRIVRGDLGLKQNPLHYPPCWNSQHVQQNSLGPQILLNNIAAGGLEDEALHCVDTTLARGYIQQCPDYFDILTEAQADTWLLSVPDMARIPNERVTDPDRMQAIIAKNIAGIPLSAEDGKALDPADPTPGIELSRKTAVEIFPPVSTRPVREFTGAVPRV